MASQNHPWFWHLCEQYIYANPSPPPPRARDPSKPMQVLCVGLPRTATESLQQALLILGYDHTYHGWDIIFDSPCHAEQWCALARRKFCGGGGGGTAAGYHHSSPSNDWPPQPETDPEGDCAISRAEFDRLLGHATAVTDAAGSCFAAELIAAYPEAKVVLNHRERDLQGWLRSANETIVPIQSSWAFWLSSWFQRDLFWAWSAYERYLWPCLFRCVDGRLSTGMGGNGKWVSREHNNMIRGLMARRKEEGRLLEWSVDEGWGPLCEFLGKEVPDQPFPRVNGLDGFDKKVEEQTAIWLKKAAVNAAVVFAVLGVAGYGVGRCVSRML